MSEPRLLDLFCCAGGAGTGYHRTGFTVYGVDDKCQLNYPFAFCQGDALDVLARLLAGEGVAFRHPDGRTEVLYLSDFVAGHGSPPCQDYTTLKSVHGNTWPRLIEALRKAFVDTGKPYVIENVSGARKELIDPQQLCGETFGLAVQRHRLFETNWPLSVPPHPKHRGKVAGWNHGKYHDGPYFQVYGNGGGKGTVAQWQEAMGIDWTDDRNEIAEAIPPAYTELIGKQLMEYLRGH